MAQDVALSNPRQKIQKKLQDFRILWDGMRVQWCMRARSFAILMAAFVGAFAVFATPAEAGGRRHYKNYYNGGYYRGGGYGGGYGYYRPYSRLQPRLAEGDITRTTIMVATIVGVATAIIAPIATMGTIARCVITDRHTTTRVLFSDRPFRSVSPLAAAATAVATAGKPHDNSVGGLKAPESTDSGAF